MAKTHILSCMTTLTTSGEVREITKAASLLWKWTNCKFWEYFWLKQRKCWKTKGQNFPLFLLPRARMKAEIIEAFIQVTHTQCWKGRAKLSFSVDFKPKEGLSPMESWINFNITENDCNGKNYCIGLTSKADGLLGCSEENDSAGVSPEGFQDSTQTWAP